MKHTTVALVQSIIGLILIITNASLQAVALSELNKSTIDNDDVKAAKKTLLISVITQFVSALLFSVTFIMLMSSTSHNAVVYGALMVSGALMITGGALGSSAALKLQCHKGSDERVLKAWKFSTYSAISGIVGAIFLLIIQTFARKDQIAQAAHGFLDKRLRQQRMQKFNNVDYRPINTRSNMYSYADEF